MMKWNEYFSEEIPGLGLLHRPLFTDVVEQILPHKLLHHDEETLRCLEPVEDLDNSRYIGHLDGKHEHSEINDEKKKVLLQNYIFVLHITHL